MSDYLGRVPRFVRAFVHASEQANGIMPKTGEVRFCLRCPSCQALHFNIIGRYTKEFANEATGRLRLKLSFSGPLQLRCCSCGSVTGLFDQKTDGYNGELDSICVQPNSIQHEESIPRDVWTWNGKVVPSTCMVRLIYDIEGLESEYPNPEDFFGYLELLARPADTNEDVVVAEYETA